MRSAFDRPPNFGSPRRNYSLNPSPKLIEAAESAVEIRSSLWSLWPTQNATFIHLEIRTRTTIGGALCASLETAALAVNALAKPRYSLSSYCHDSLLARSNTLARPRTAHCLPTVTTRCWLARTLWQDRGLFNAFPLSRIVAGSPEHPGKAADRSLPSQCHESLLARSNTLTRPRAAHCLPTVTTRC